MSLVSSGVLRCPWICPWVSSDVFRYPQILISSLISCFHYLHLKDAATRQAEGAADIVDDLAEYATSLGCHVPDSKDNEARVWVAFVGSSK